MSIHSASADIAREQFAEQSASRGLPLPADDGQTIPDPIVIRCVREQHQISCTAALHGRVCRSHFPLDTVIWDGWREQVKADFAARKNGMQGFAPYGSDDFLLDEMGMVESIPEIYAGHSLGSLKPVLTTKAFGPYDEPSQGCRMIWHALRLTGDRESLRQFGLLIQPRSTICMTLVHDVQSGWCLDLVSFQPFHLVERGYPGCSQEHCSLAPLFQVPLIQVQEAMNFEASRINGSARLSI